MASRLMPLAVPRKRNLAVVKGTKATSSCEGPLRSSTPMTSSGTCMILTCAPIGSSSGANNSRATALPRMTTFAALASSPAEKYRPDDTCQSRTMKCAVVVPLIVVFQFLLSRMTCAVPATEPAAAWISGI